ERTGQGDLAGTAAHREMRRPEATLQVERDVKRSVELQMRAREHGKIRSDQAEGRDVDATIAAMHRDFARRRVENKPYVERRRITQFDHLGRQYAGDASPVARQVDVDLRCVPDQPGALVVVDESAADQMRTLQISGRKVRVG